MFPKMRCGLLFLLGWIFFSVPYLAAQVDRTAITGTVKDAQGKVMPGVHIIASQQETGLTRTSISSATGTYDIPELPVGIYNLTFASDGFEDLIVHQVLQVVGQTRTLDAMLKPSGGQHTVVVSDVASELNKTSDSLGARIERKQIDELPNNGRNWSTLTALVPGAVDTGGSNQRSIRFAGRGLDDNNFTYDGIDATNIVNQAQQSFVRLAIPTDAIQEFRIDSMLFTAENGSTPGGQIAVVSKSGSNEFHGNMFEYLRNDIFDAREPLDTLNPSKPPFRLNQFGAALGGPIVRNHTFFYGTYEGLRQSWGQALPGFVPSASFRAAVAAQSPALIPILDAFPLGQIPVSTDESEYMGFGKQIDDEDSGMLRIDERFSPKDTAFLRFNFDAALSDAPLEGGSSYLNDRQLVSSRPVNGELEYLHIFSPSLIDEARFGYNRGNVYTTNQGMLNSPYAISISTFTTLNSNEYKPSVGNSFSYIDDLTQIKGRHTLKYGVEVRRIQLNQGNTANGTITFSSLAAFQANQVSSATYSAELPINGLRKTEVYAYAQDEWKFRPNLTFNLGVRYSFYNRFHEVFNRAIPFDFATCGPQGFCPSTAEFSRPNVFDIDPRIAIAWAPTALHNQTTIRTGFGIYHGDGQLDDQNLPIDNEVDRYSLSAATIPNLSYPITPFLADTPGIVSPRDDDRDRKDMYVSQWGLSVQQSLPHSLVGTLAYVGSKGTDLLTTSYINLINPATGLRPYPNFGQVEWRGNINNSSYEAMVATLQRSFQNGLLLAANYVWSHEIDQDAAGGGDSDFPQNPACLSCERASGDFDARNVFTGNTVYSLPFGKTRKYLQRGLANALLGDWDASGIFTARSGLPVNVTIDRSSSDVATGYTTNQRPNRVPGVSLKPPGGQTIEDWINPAAFAPVVGGGYGNAPRNLVRGPDLWQADLGLEKHIPLPKGLQIQFGAEFFNIFNRGQYGLPLSDFSSYLDSQTGGGNSTFGQIIDPVNVGPVGTGTPRQIQFMLRLQM
jgi:Carboxypeptidase regulatory-like domain/TonB dependent receptor